MFCLCQTGGQARVIHKAAKLFRAAAEAETVHAGLYQKVLENLKDLEEVGYYVCSVCGFTCEKEAPEKCPVSGSKSEVFSRVE